MSGRELDRNGTLVVVGASLAGLRAVTGARSAGFEGRIVLIGDESELPYDRPPLSKAFLLGEVDDTTYPDSSRLEGDLSVELRLGARAEALDPIAHRVALAGGAAVGYDRLVVATGTRAIVPDFVREGPARGVHVLRCRDDAAAIRAALRPGVRLVVVGGGFIGGEVASAAREIGASVTVVDAAPVPLARATGALGGVVSELHGLNGVDLLLDAQVAQLQGTDDVESVLLTDGTVIPADLVVVGVGARPATDWLAGSGLQLHPEDGGVVCDASLATSIEDVWAAGDLVHWPDGDAPAARLENWTNASLQGAHAARNAVRGLAAPFSTIPYYWTQWYGHQIQFVGVPEAEQVLVAGGVAQGRMIGLYRHGDALVGALTVGEPGRVMKLRRSMAGDGSWDAARALVVQWGDRLQDAADPDVMASTRESCI